MKNLFFSPALWCASALALPAASILSPTDMIIGYDLDAAGWYPDGEAPPKAVDGDTGSKYLNFGMYSTGVIMPLSGGAATARSVRLATANDDDRRDPTSYVLFGTTSAITSTNNSNGLSENWTLIGNGTLSLPTDRNTWGDPVNIGTPGSYSAYWIVFPSIRDGSTNSMQISEVQLWDGADATGSVISVNAGAAIGTGWGSNFPGGEAPANILDGDPNTKYLNFGMENSGFWVVPSMGASVVRSFAITTANDWLERDPASFRLLGQAADGVWSLIDEGPLSLPDGRFESATVGIDNDTAYLAYRMEFPTLKDAGATNSMQIAEVQFFDVIPEASASLLAAGALATLLIRRRR